MYVYLYQLLSYIAYCSSVLYSYVCMYYNVILRMYVCNLILEKVTFIAFQEILILNIECAVVLDL